MIDNGWLEGQRFAYKGMDLKKVKDIGYRELAEYIEEGGDWMPSSRTSEKNQELRKKATYLVQKQNGLRVCGNGLRDPEK